MICEDFLARYSDYLDALLPPAGVAEMDSHIEGCLRCARYDRVMRRGLELARLVPAVSPSDDFEARLRHRLMHVRDEDGESRGIGTGAAVSLAVAALLAVAAWSPLFRSVPSQSPTRYEASLSPVAPEIDLAWRDALEQWWKPGSLPVQRTLSGAFPGPYSPLVVTPPSIGTHSSGVHAVVASYPGID